MNGLSHIYEYIAELEKYLAHNTVEPGKRKWLESLLKIHREIAVGREKLDEYQLIFDAIDRDPERKKQLKMKMDQIFYKVMNQYFIVMMSNDPTNESFYKNMLQDAVKEYEHVTSLSKK